MRLPMALLFLVVGLVPAVCRGQQPSASPRYEQWRLVAQSDLILKAELVVPVGAIRSSLQSGTFSFVTLRARVIQVLKGTPDSSVVEINDYTKPDHYSPSPQAVIALDHKQVLLFLARASTSDRMGVYFASGTPKALQAIDPVVMQRVREEIEVNPFL